MGVSAESRRRSSRPGGRGDVQAGQDQLWRVAGFLVGIEWAAWGGGGSGQGHYIRTMDFVPRGEIGRGFSQSCGPLLLNHSRMSRRKGGKGVRGSSLPRTCKLLTLVFLQNEKIT